VILDSSAVVAIFTQEPEAETFLAAIANARSVAISAATFVELGIVLSYRFAEPLQDELEIFFNKLGVSVTPFTDAHRSAALSAWWKFGRTRSKAKLNFGDCIAYATAKLAGEPLLFKGDDFRKTDIAPAL
jgi:ribonuclease VapC